MSLMHTNTFLRSSLISDPYTFGGDLDVEDVLRIQNQFPTLFESQNPQDHHHRTNEKISKILITKKKFGEKPSNDSKIQNASSTTTTNLKDHGTDDKILKKSTSTISKDKIIHHYEMPVKCTRSRCTEKARHLAVQPSKSSLFSRKPSPSYQSQLSSKIKPKPKYRNTTKPQDLPQSPYKEPLVDNYLKYVQRFYKKHNKSPSPSQNLQIVGQSNSKISIDGKRSVTNSNVQNIRSIENVKWKPNNKLKSSISLGQMDLNLRKSPDELVDEVLEKTEEFTSESQERFEQILLTKLLASKYEEHDQFYDQKCNGLMKITEVSEPDLSIISSLVESQVKQQNPQRSAEIDPKSVKSGEKFEQNRNIFKTNILQARCVAGKGFDEFDFFEEVSIIGEECDEIDPEVEPEISKILEKNAKNAEKSRVFQESRPNTSNKVHFRDFQDYISTSSTPKTSSSNSNEFSLIGQKDSIKDQFGQDDQDHDLSNIKNKLNDRMTKSSAEGVTEKMLVQIAKKLIKTEVENYFKRSSQIKFEFEDFEKNFDELKTPTGSTGSRPRGVPAKDPDDEYLNIKTPELTPPSRNGKKPHLDKKVSTNTMLKTPEKTPPGRYKDQLKTPGQDDPTDCSEISSFICSEVPSIPEKDHGEESSEELITPKLTPTSEKKSRSKVKVKSQKNHTQSSIHPFKTPTKIPQSIMKSGKSSEKTLKNVQSLSPESQGWMKMTPSPQIKVNNEAVKSSPEDFDCAKSKSNLSKKSPTSNSRSKSKSMKVFKKFSPLPEDYESSKVGTEKENIIDEDDDGTLKESIISELEESLVEKLSTIADQDQDQDGYSLYDLLSEGEYIGNKIKSPGEITPAGNDFINLSLKYFSTSNSFTDISTGDSCTTIQDEKQFKNKDFINALSQGEFI